MKKVILGSALVMLGFVQAASANDTCFNSSGHPYHCQEWAFSSASSSTSTAGPAYQVTGTSVTTRGRTGSLSLTAPDGTVCSVHFRAENHQTVTVWSSNGCAFVNPEGPQ